MSRAATGEETFRENVKARKEDLHIAEKELEVRAAEAAGGVKFSTNIIPFKKGASGSASTDEDEEE